MIFYTTAVIVVVLDQVTKLLVVLFIAPNNPFASVTVIQNVFDLVHRKNTGAAFSLFQEYPLVLTAVSVVAVILIFFWQRSIPRNEKWLILSLGMIWGGALGNLCDRFFRGGSVVDFIYVHWDKKFEWPAFNVADTCICLGVGLFTLLLVREAIQGRLKVSGKKGET